MLIGNGFLSLLFYKLYFLLFNVPEILTGLDV